MAKKAIFIALDNSGSMAGERITSTRMAMINAINGFAEFLDDPANTLDIGISIWGDAAVTRVWRGISRAGVGGATAFLDGLDALSGGTNFAAFAPDALAFFEATLGENYEERKMIFLTDGEPTPLSSADEAATILADVLDRSTVPFGVFDGSEVDCFAANIDLGTTVHTAKLDNTERDGTPIITGSTRALTTYLKEVTFPTLQSRSWGWPIQWSQGYEEELSFRTEIIISRDGTEQRIGQRINPRVNYEYTSVLSGRNLQSAIARVVHNQGKQYYVQHPREPVILETGLTSIGMSFTLMENPPGWLVPGVYAVLQSPLGETALAAVVFVSGKSIGLAVPVGKTFPPGSKMRLGVKGRFDGATEFSLVTNSVATTQTKFTGDPVDTPHLSFGAAPLTLDGSEIFFMRPNWRAGMDISIEQQIELLDLERGAIDAIFPITFSPRTQKHAFTARTMEELDLILGLFYRCAGRRKMFFMPLWADEIRPLGVTYTGGTAITVRGSDFGETYGELGTYRRIIIRRVWDTLILEVDSVTLDSAGNSVINLVAPVETDIIESEIMNMNWIMPVRFASDRLSVNWLTDGVAEITISITTLEGEA